MNGPEHYRAAEQLLAEADRWENNIVDDDTTGYLSIDSARRAAQAHATLAMVAATVHTLNPAPGDHVGQQWIGATS